MTSSDVEASLEWFADHKTLSMKLGHDQQGRLVVRRFYSKEISTTKLMIAKIVSAEFKPMCKSCCKKETDKMREGFTWDYDLGSDGEGDD
jgi:hypothetical protein